MIHARPQAWPLLRAATAESRRRAGAIAVARDAKWDLLLVCLAGYVLTSVGRVHQLFPVLSPLRPAILTGALALWLYLVDASEKRRATRVFGATSRWLMALLAWMVLGIPGALRVGNSFELLADNFIKTVLMYFVLAGAVRGLRDVERLALVYFMAAVVYAAVAVQRFDLGDAAWRLMDLYYYDANDFATFVVTAIPLGFHFLAGDRRPLTRVAAATGLGVLTLGFVRSGSRGGFVALVAVLAFVLVSYRSIRARWRVLGTAFVVAGVLATASGQFWTQMGTILTDSDYNVTDESGRVEIWRRGVGYMLDAPIFGVGANNFPVAEGTLSPFAERQQFGIGVRWNAAHNSFVQIGAELGVPGLLFFLAVIGTAFRALHGVSRRSTGSAPAAGVGPSLARALTASLVGFVVGAFFLSLAYSEMLYTLVALAVALHKVTAGDDDLSRPGLPPR